MYLFDSSDVIVEHEPFAFCLQYRKTLHYVGSQGTQGLYFFIVFGLLSSQLRYLQVTMWIWRKYNINESKTEWRSCCLHDQVGLCWGQLFSRETGKKLQEPQEIYLYKEEAAIEPKINANEEKLFYWCFICL